MEKSPEAYRTISEVSKELNLPSHVLRFWETKFSQIKPLKRSGNRRYYRPQDIEVLKSIRKYLYDDGYTIKGLQKLVRAQSGVLLNTKTLKESDTTDHQNTTTKHEDIAIISNTVTRLEELANYIKNKSFHDI